MGAYETDELATGCGKFIFICFAIILVLVAIAFMLGRFFRWVC
jgi:hypothetical protein